MFRGCHRVLGVTVFRGCDRVLGGATCVFEPTFRDRFYLTIKGY